MAVRQADIIRAGSDIWGRTIVREYPEERPAPASRSVSPRPPLPAPPRPAPAPAPPTQPSVPAYKPQPWTPPTTDVDIVNEIADCLNKPPTDIDQNYILRAMHIAEYLRVPASTETSAQLATNTKDLERLFVQSPKTNPQRSLTRPVTWVANEAGRALANQSVANVLALIKRAEDFLARAASVGYVPPDNPFSVISTLNAARRGTFTRIDVAQQLASDLLYSVKVIIDLIETENQGGLDLAHGTVNSAQLSHVHLSFDGFGGSGNPGADILRFLPSADEIKKQTEEQALAVLDFSRRVPYIMFTMEYKPVHDAPPVGTLIGWKRIADASGYVLNRRDVFSQVESRFTIDNQTLDQLSQVLRDYIKTYATTFFNKMDEKSVVVFLDTSQSSDEFYVYTIQAYQVRSEGRAATFSIQSSPVSLTPTAKTSVNQVLGTIDPSFTNTGTETVSPWPALAQYIYGNTNYDWLLAAVNTRASINRGDLRSVTRNYSYLNAHLKFLYTQADAGQLVKPADVNDVINRVNDSIQKFGVQQTIQDLLDETGISYYFEGRDAREDTHFDRAGTETVQTSNLFAVIGASIDPDTAMLDLKTLSNNMSQLLSQNLLTTATSVQPGAAASADSKPTEITVPQPNEMTADQADGPLQYIGQLGDMRDPNIDLTTFDGISKLMRVIRILSDFGPNRVVPQPVKVTPQPLPAPVVTQPGSPAPITTLPVIRPTPIINTGPIKVTTQAATTGGGGGGGRSISTRTYLF